MVSKRWKAFEMVEQYILQQRKRNIVIYTNDAEMKKLFEKAYPNIAIEVLDVDYLKPYFNHYNSNEVIKQTEIRGKE